MSNQPAQASAESPSSSLITPIANNLSNSNHYSPAPSAEFDRKARTSQRTEHALPHTIQTFNHILRVLQISWASLPYLVLSQGFARDQALDVLSFAITTIPGYLIAPFRF